jgi:ParB/RepB/Spo0J family partition protein
MTVIEMPIGELIPYENNPRRNDAAVDNVAASIQEFGFKVPIIVDKNNVIVAGHTRLKAAEKLGLETVPVVRADDLNEEQAKAFRLADNKTAEFSEWDFEKLEQKLSLIENIDMSQFGFDKLEPVDVDDFTEESEHAEKEEKPEFVTCPFCGHTFDAKTAEGWSA